MDHCSCACSPRLLMRKRLCLQFTIRRKKAFSLYFSCTAQGFLGSHVTSLFISKGTDLLKCPIWWYNQIHWRKCPGCNKCEKHQNQRDLSPFLRMQINHLWQVEMKKRMKNIGVNCKSKQTASEQKWNAKPKDFRIKRVTFVIISTAQGKKPVFRRATELNVMHRKQSMRCTLWHLSDQANEPSVHSAGLLASCDLSDGCNTLLLLTCEHVSQQIIRLWYTTSSLCKENSAGT